MKRQTLEQFHAELAAQGVIQREHLACKCPACGTVQSIALLRSQGCPAEKVETQWGFSCVGRWNGAGAPTRDGKPRNADKPGCNWTLGGFLQLHKLEVDKGGESFPCFELATPAEAQALKQALAK